MSNQQRRLGPLESMLGLLGAGILGTIAFVLLAILLAPILIAIFIWMAIVRWRMKKAMQEMARQAESPWGQAPGEPPRARKKVHARVSEPE